MHMLSLLATKCHTTGQYVKIMRALSLSVCLSVSLPPCLSVCFPPCLSVGQLVCLPVRQPVCLHVCLPAFLPRRLSACLSVRLPVSLSFFVSLFCLSVDLSACVPACLLYLLQQNVSHKLCKMYRRPFIKRCLVVKRCYSRIRNLLYK